MAPKQNATRARRFSDVDGERAGQAGGAFGRDAAVADQDVDCGEIGVSGANQLLLARIYLLRLDKPQRLAQEQKKRSNKMLSKG